MSIEWVSYTTLLLVDYFAQLLNQESDEMQQKVFKKLYYHTIYKSEYHDLLTFKILTFHEPVITE